MKLEINNQIKARYNRKSLESLIIKAQDLIPPLKGQILSLAFVGAAEIRRLNRDFRGINKVSDTLSFQYQKEPGYFLPYKAKSNQVPVSELGDIIICWEQVKKQAQNHKHSIKKEIEKLFVHSLLHLLGYDHQDENSARKMYKLQDLFFK